MSARVASRRIAARRPLFTMRIRMASTPNGRTHPTTTSPAEAETAWRERPPPWPRAWQTKRPNHVVAHATVLRLTTSPAAWPLSGGTDRRPRRVFNNSQRWLKLAAGVATVRRIHIDRDSCEPGEWEGEHLARGPVPPPCSPSCSPWTCTAESGTPSAWSSNCESTSRSSDDRISVPSRDSTRAATNLVHVISAPTTAVTGGA